MTQATIPPAPPECQTEAEKTAYAFGYWQGLHAQRAPASGVQYVHMASKKVYDMIGSGLLQTDKPLFDMAAVVAYRGGDGRLWVRRAAEFDDRFERVRVALP